MMGNSSLSDYRFFDSDKKIRNIAYKLYSNIKTLPILSPHGHVDPKLLAENNPFPDPTELIIIPDHYIYRMLYSNGINMESLGIPSIDDAEVEKDHRKIWQIFADNYFLFAGTPSGIWLKYIFAEVFGINEKLNSHNALKFYDEMQAKLNSDDFLPRTLFNKFNIEVLNTTDAASDTLKNHKNNRQSGWKGRVIPCFRPDAIVNITTKSWKYEIYKLADVCGYEIKSFKEFIKAVEQRRMYFIENGAVSTDQGIANPYAHELSYNEADSIFQRALKGKATNQDEVFCFLFT